jgi:hypothetical protein
LFEEARHVLRAAPVFAMLGEEDPETRKEFTRPLDAHHDP